MAVLANKRHTSGIEYENTLTKFIRYINYKLNRIPKRMSDCLAKPFYNAISDAYNIVMDLSENYKQGKRATTERYKLCKRMLGAIHNIVACTYVYWFVSFEKNTLKPIRLKARIYWSNFINREIALIIGVMKQCKGYKERDVTIYMMNPLSTKNINQTKFIKNMAELNNIIIKRSAHMSKRYPDVQMGVLVTLSREALYCAVQGNIFPTTKMAYEMRKKYFNDLVNIIHKMNRPIKELSFNKVFSEEELNRIGHLMQSTLNIIPAVQKSDELRFGNL